MNRNVIVCCNNNDEILNSCLLQSINNKSKLYDLIIIDNKDNRFFSCADAYNSIIDKTNYDVYLFAHNDIKFNNDTIIKKYIEYLNCNRKTIIGCAGASEEGKYSNILHGNNKKAGKHINNIKDVQTLDECFFGFYQNNLNKLRFDSIACNNYHLYAVDLCLYAKLNGYSIKVMPSENSIYHLSNGEINENYINSMINLRKKYCGSYDVIYTTCYSFRTNSYSFNKDLIKLIANSNVKVKRLIYRVLATMYKVITK